MGARAHGAVEIIGEWRVVLANAGQCLPHRARDARPGPLRRRAGAAIAATEANRARQLANQELAFGSGLRDPPEVCHGSGFVDVLVDLDEPPPVGFFGAGVEERSRIPFGDCARFVPGRSARCLERFSLQSDELEYVKLATWFGE